MNTQPIEKKSKCLFDLSLAFHVFDSCNGRIQSRSELVATGNFSQRKDLETCSLTSRNLPHFYKAYTN